MKRKKSTAIGSIFAVIVLLALVFTACKDDAGGSTGTAPTITTAALPDGEVGTAYSGMLAATGDAPITWSVESGDLPGGLTLSSAGVISGTPSAAGAFNFTVKAANAAGSGTKQLSITILAAAGTFDNPIQLTKGVWVDGNLSANGEQWFKLTTTMVQNRVHFKAGTLTEVNAQRHNMDGTPATASPMHCTDGYRFTVAESVTIGTVCYYKVWPYNSGESGTYKIAFNESNTAPLPSSGITTLTADTWANGNITTSVREQWFKFSATAATQYIHFEEGTLDDVYVQVYDSTGATLGSLANLYGSYLYISRGVTSGNVYYIRVTPYYSSDSGAFRIAFNTTSMAP
jgi:hypothetical protein